MAHGSLGRLLHQYRVGLLPGTSLESQGDALIPSFKACVFLQDDRHPLAPLGVMLTWPKSFEFFGRRLAEWEEEKLLSRTDWIESRIGYFLGARPSAGHLPPLSIMIFICQMGTMIPTL